MERDFLGLSSKNDLEEALDGSKNQASLRGSSIQWPFSNKIAAVPHFLSFKAGEDDKVQKTVVDPLTSDRFMAWPASYSFNSLQRPNFGALQENGIIDSKAGLTVLPLEKLEPLSIDRPSIHSQLISNIGQQPQGVSFVGPFMGHPIPSPSSKNIFSLTRRNPSKSSVSPQLTIFYGGSVSVYDDISPESAQAIMLLATNRSTKPENNPSLTPPMKVQSQCHKSGRPDLLHPNFCQHVKVGGSCCASGLTTTKPSGILGPLKPSLEAIKSGSTVGSSASYVSSAVPQARKASLARFLVKRKERKLNASPYNFPESECSSYIVDHSGTGPSSSESPCIV